MKLKIDIVTNKDTNTNITKALLNLLSKYENIIKNSSINTKDK